MTFWNNTFLLERHATWHRSILKKNNGQTTKNSLTYGQRDWMIHVTIAELPLRKISLITH